MESVELALKNSDRNEKTVTGGAQNGEDLSVDDLLDFSNEDDDFFVEDEAELKVQRNGGVSDDTTLHRSNDFSTADFPTSELSVPMDDLAELEWLSNFVEDSFTPYSAAPTKKPVWLTGNRMHPVPPVNEETCFNAPPPVNTRPKRARTELRVLSYGSPSSSSATPSPPSSGPSSPLWLAGAEFRARAKRQNKEMVCTRKSQTQTQMRRCSHCGVQKTPQWRAGPLGAKTLCNACGVRYKTGRLLPEYRPACSPTFSSEIHSNNHRRVIEMRQKKETSDDVDETGLNQSVQVVPSF